MTTKVVAWIDVTVCQNFSSLAKTSLKGSNTQSNIEKVLDTLLNVIKAIKTPLNKMSEIKISLIKTTRKEKEKRIDVNYNPKELPGNENEELFLETIKIELDEALAVLCSRAAT